MWDKSREDGDDDDTLEDVLHLVGLVRRFKVRPSPKNPAARQRQRRENGNSSDGGGGGSGGIGSESEDFARKENDGKVCGCLSPNLPLFTMA